jgi:hypothetical protein
MERWARSGRPFAVVVLSGILLPCRVVAADGPTRQSSVRRYEGVRGCARGNCRTDPCQQRLLAGGGLRQQGFESTEVSDVTAVLFATRSVGAAGLGAHEGLRRASAVGDMRHVETVTFGGSGGTPLRASRNSTVCRHSVARSRSEMRVPPWRPSLASTGASRASGATFVVSAIRAYGLPDDLPRLRRGNGKRHRAHALDVEPRHWRLDRTEGAKISRAFDRRQRLCQRVEVAVVVHLNGGS